LLSLILYDYSDRLYTLDGTHFDIEDEHPKSKIIGNYFYNFAYISV